MSTTDVSSAVAQCASSDLRPHVPAHDPQSLPREGTGRVRTGVLNTILSMSRPADMPTKWAFLDRSEHVRQLRCASDDLRAALRDKFSDEDLLATRVLRRRTDQLELSDVLGDTTSKFMITLDRESRPVDVVSTRGSLFAECPPWLRCAMVRLANEGQDKVQAMFLANTDDDAQVMLGLGLRCTPSAGLDRIDGDTVHRMFQDTDEIHNRCRYRLTLPAWGIADVVPAPSADIKSILARLELVEHIYPYDPAVLFEVWWPDPLSISNIEKSLAFLDRDLTLEQLITSARTSMCTPLEASYELPSAGTGDLRTMYREMIDVLTGPQTPRTSLKVQKLLDQLSQAMQTTFVDRCWEAAASGSPV